MDLTNPQSMNRYSYVLNNPLRAIDPLGLECVWDDGSFDSANDPVTGSYGGCNAAGGTWFDHDWFVEQNLGDWSPNPNGDLADLVGISQNGIPDAIVYGNVSDVNAVSSWGWTFTKTFVSNFFSPKFYKQELREGGCLDTFLEGVDKADVLGPVLNGSPGIAETAIKGEAASIAASYAAHQGLTVPLRSSVVRGILEKGETGAGAFGIAYFDMQAGAGIFKETQAALAGTCH